jgi:hypothetical protein
VSQRCDVTRNRRPESLPFFSPGRGATRWSQRSSPRLDPTVAAFAPPSQLPSAWRCDDRLNSANISRFGTPSASRRLVTSMGSRGYAYDNALAESFTSLYKVELIHRRLWRGLDDVEFKTLEYIDWFRGRLHGRKNVTPMVESMPCGYGVGKGWPGIWYACGLILLMD